MLIVMAAGTALTLLCNAMLFDVVAVSGTASMFFAPLLFVGLVRRRRVALRGYMLAFGAAMLGSFAYLARDWGPVLAGLPEAHEFVRLLAICICVLTVGFAAVLAAAQKG
jgi:hypothetical protein